MQESEVLVVGAGPVGMFTALCLAEQGVRPAIIDDEWRTAVHSYACALHPGTLRLLESLGMATELLPWGQRIDTVAFFDGPSRTAEMRLRELSGGFPFLLVLPQAALEGLLEEQLWRRWGIRVLWNHRLSDLQAESEDVVATIDKLGGSATGHTVPRWDMVVKKRLETRVAFVVGADGHESWVRRRLGIENECLGEPEVFAVHEFASDASLSPEVSVVLDARGTNVLWPLPGGKCRWSQQWGRRDPDQEFPVKGRSPVRVFDEAVDHAARVRLQRQLRERAPWFTGTVGEVHWSMDVQFERRLVRQFGLDRCWLAGDAAHQTSPVGVQSLNVGLREAAELATCLRAVLKEGQPAALLDCYGEAFRREWRQLFGAAAGLQSGDPPNAWTLEHRTQLLPCVPASGDELSALLRQIGLGFLEGGTT